MNKIIFAAALLAACGDNRRGIDVDAAIDARPVVPGDAPVITPNFFGEACTQAPLADVTICHDGAGACVMPGICRPWCTGCDQRGGIVFYDPKGACVCVPR